MRVHRKDGPTPVELAAAMLRELTAWLPQRRCIAHFDGFYASLAVTIPQVCCISRMRCHAWINHLPAARTPHTRGRKRKRGDKLPWPEELAHHIRHFKKVTTRERRHKRQRLVWSQKVIWYNMSRKPILMVISRDPAGREKDDFFFTTDLTMKPQDVISQYAGRWAIEDTFKNTKQLLGGQQPQSFKRQGPERTAALSLWLYATVWLWYLRQNRRCPRLPSWPWYPGKSRPSFADALSALRQRLWRQRIKNMFGKPFVHQKIPEILIAALSAAA